MVCDRHMLFSRLLENIIKERSTARLAAIANEVHVLLQ